MVRQYPIERAIGRCGPEPVRLRPGHKRRAAVYLCPGPQLSESGDLLATFSQPYLGGAHCPVNDSAIASFWAPSRPRHSLTRGLCRADLVSRRYRISRIPDAKGSEG